METVLLNPNTTVRNPVAQQGIMDTRSDDSQDFSPLMNEAVENIENGQSPQDPETQQDTDQPENSLSLDSPQDDNDIDLSNEAILFTETTNNTNNLNITGIDKSSIATIPAENSPLNYALIANSSIVIPTDGASTLKMAVQGTTINQLIEPAPRIQSEIAIPDKNTETPAITPSDKTNTVATSKTDSILLQQIHQILDQGRENGTIVIRGNELPGHKLSCQMDNLQNLSPPVMPDTKTENGAIQTKQAGIPFSIIDDSNKNTQKSAKLEGVHQDVSEQFLNAKLGQSKGSTKDNAENTNSGQKGFSQANKGELQQAATTPGNTVTEVKVVESSFGQQPGQVSGSATQTTSSGVEGKFAPGAQTPVPEKELVANLIHRFSVNPRLQTSRITMQLNPAELGSLKIDILVKADSIKANVIAQSQQVLETLEKSVPRLRSVLEEQGFRIDSFEISMDGDGGSQKELFQEQFNSRQQGFASRESSTEKTDSFDTLLNTQEETLSRDEEKTGVNLTI